MFAIQDVVVTLVALLAAGFVLRRVIGTFAPEKTAPPCANCPSGCAASTKGPSPAGLPPDERPEASA